LNYRIIKIIRTALVFLLFTLTFLIFADDEKDDIHTVRIIIPKVALLDIEAVNTKNITLKMISPSEPGDPLMSVSDNRIWLNVTSVIESGNDRTITVKIDEPLSGIDLKVLSGTYSGAGFGSWGTPQPELTLTQMDQTLVNGIKSGETGNGANNGYNLQYLAQSNNADYDKITSTSGKSITVTYTLTH